MELLPGNIRTDNDISTIPLKSLAHLGDAVYELFIRRKTIFMAHKVSNLHKLNSLLVNSNFHADLFEYLKDKFTPEELDLTRRARNLSLTTTKRKNFKAHRTSTSLEAIIGFLYLSDKERLSTILNYTETYVDSFIETLGNNSSIGE